MKLILMRHAEVTASPDIYLGRTDVDLSKKGIAHAKNIVKKLEKDDIDAIYSSGLKRSRHTVDIVSKGLGVEVKGHVKDLNEVDFGVIEGLTRSEAEKKYPEVMKQRDSNRMGFRIPKGESSEDAAKRALNALKKIVKDNEGKTVLVVIHGMLMRIIMAKITNKSLRDTYDDEFNYGCRMVFETNSGKLLFKKFIPE